ncbi:MAG: four helix bundle protein [Chloroflexi bacterium]|nr:MAG: four helix bundle protein [Chloroflexota bacterium]
MNSYKELLVWQKAVDLVTQVYQLTGKFPKEERYGLISQLRRSAVSVPSNIAEGWGRGNTREYIRFLTIARGSLMELETQIIISEKMGFLQYTSQQLLLTKIDEIGRMLNGLITSLKSKGGK